MPISNVVKLDNLINNAVRRIFNVSEPANILYVRRAVGLENLEETRKRRIGNFVMKMLTKSHNFRDVIFRGAVNSDRWLSSVVRKRGIASGPGDVVVDIRTALADLRLLDTP